MSLTVSTTVKEQSSTYLSENNIYKHNPVAMMVDG